MPFLFGTIFFDPVTWILSRHPDAPFSPPPSRPFFHSSKNICSLFFPLFCWCLGSDIRLAPTLSVPSRTLFPFTWDPFPSRQGSALGPLSSPAFVPLVRAAFLFQKLLFLLVHFFLFSRDPVGLSPYCISERVGIVDCRKEHFLLLVLLTVFFSFPFQNAMRSLSPPLSATEAPICEFRSAPPLSWLYFCLCS